MEKVTVFKVRFNEVVSTDYVIDKDKNETLKENKTK